MKRIIIIDDSIPVVKIMSHALEKLYPSVFEITTESVTARAEKLLLENDYDIIFCDVVIFTKSGFQLINDVLDKKPDLKEKSFVVIMSSAPSVIYEDEISQLIHRLGPGNFCFIHKPLVLSNLIDCVEMVYPELEPDKEALRKLSKIFRFDK